MGMASCPEALNAILFCGKHWLYSWQVYYFYKQNICFLKHAFVTTSHVSYIVAANCQFCDCVQFKYMVLIVCLYFLYLYLYLTLDNKDSSKQTN